MQHRRAPGNPWQADVRNRRRPAGDWPAVSPADILRRAMPHSVHLTAVLAAAAFTPATHAAAAQEACRLTAAGTAQVASCARRQHAVADRRTHLAARRHRGERCRARHAASAGRREDAAAGTDGRRSRPLRPAGSFRLRRRGPAIPATGIAASRRGAAALLAARQAHRGPSTDPNFALLAADNLARLALEKGHFALVEGDILSVHASGATIYLNFGPRWTKDFSVIILRRNQRKFAAAGIEPRRLQGRRVRVRGWIEQRRGPIIQADTPERVELLK